MYKKLTLIAVGLGAMLVLSGCGSDRRASVSGKVTVAGKGPLPGGNIRFISVADPNKIGGGQIKADGTYEVPDAPVGECKVVIDNTHLDPATLKGAGLPGMMGPGGGMGGMKGAPKTGGIASGPKAADKAKMGESPKGTDVPAEMGKSETTGQKFVKIEAGFTRADTTTLKADVKNGANDLNFDVK